MLSKILIVNLATFLSFGFLALTLGAEYTKREKETINQLHMLVDDILTQEYTRTDSYLLTWLRANDLNIKPAANQLKNHLKWRMMNDVDNILNELDLDEQKHSLPYLIQGFDKSGRPIIDIFWGHWNYRKYVETGKENIMERHFILMLEKAYQTMRRVAEKTGKDIDQIYMINEMDGFNVDSTKHICDTCWSLIFDLIKIYDVEATPFVKNCTVIDTPWIFEPVAIAMKQSWNKFALDRFALYGQNKDMWKKALARDIDPEQLPLRLGGTNKDFF